MASSEQRNEVDIAKHDLRLEQLEAELADLHREFEKGRAEWNKRWGEIDRLTGIARALFILAVAVGGFISWFIGMADHVRRWFSQGN